jgi:hypothetical protein
MSRMVALSLFFFFYAYHLVHKVNVFALCVCVLLGSTYIRLRIFRAALGRDWYLVANMPGPDSTDRAFLALEGPTE